MPSPHAQPLLLIRFASVLLAAAVFALLAPAVLGPIVGDSVAALAADPLALNPPNLTADKLPANHLFRRGGGVAKKSTSSSKTTTSSNSKTTSTSSATTSSSSKTSSTSSAKSTSSSSSSKTTSTSSSSSNKSTTGTSTSTSATTTPAQTSSPATNTTTTSAATSTVTHATDGSCGSGKGSCFDGFCCSQYGYCGQTDAYCGTGCQTAYGLCGNISTIIKPTTTASATPTTTSPVVVPTFVSTTGQCGSTAGLCPLGLCCGQWGWCGNDISSCSVSSGCNPLFGDCDGLPQDKNINIVYRCQVPGTVAITFDDGPYTSMATIANAFKAAGGRTTFFINGNNADCVYDHAADLAAAYNDGHQIGAHTWSHPDIATLSVAELLREMQLIEDAIKMITGARPNYFRPPFGSYNRTSADLVAAMGYTHFVLWDMTPQEMSNGRDQSTDADVANEKATYNNADLGTPHVFLQHSTVAKTVSDMVPFIINWAKSKNLTMVTVADCLGGAPKYRDVGQPTPRNASWTCDV
ncbi:hypothetical protein DFJ73DRAFT_655726 [Zopfochytrium polystomum]|nr:hypothetical protein DFJ73DRAFT_655726 [Zopfochytrium polystomum]